MQSKKGFSFVELLIILVFVFIILASLMPMITRRHMAPPEKADHGTYACYWERKADGSHILKQTFIKGKRTVVSDEATEVCKFDPPKKAKYFYVQLIGGGGGGKKLEWEDIDPATNEAYRVKGHSSLAKYPIVGQSGSNSYSQDMFDKKEYKALVNDHKIVLHADAGEGGVCDPELFKEFSCDHGEKDDVPFCMQNIPEGRKVGDINLSECSSLGCYISEYKYIKSKCPDGKINTENNSCDCSGVKVSIKKTDPVQYIEMLSQVAMTPDICYNDKHGAALPEHYRTESLSDYFGPFRKVNNPRSMNSTGSDALLQYARCSYDKGLTAKGMPTGQQMGYLGQAANGDGVLFLPPNGTDPLLETCGGQGAEIGRMRGNNSRYKVGKPPVGKYQIYAGDKYCSVKEAYAGTDGGLKDGYQFGGTDVQPSINGKTHLYDNLYFADVNLYQTQEIPYGVGGRAGEIKTLVLKKMPKEGVTMLPGKGGDIGKEGQTTIFGKVGTEIPVSKARGGKPGTSFFTVDAQIGPYRADGKTKQTKESNPQNRITKSDSEASRNGEILSYSTFVNFIISYTNDKLRNIMKHFGEGGSGTSTVTNATCGYLFNPLLFKDGTKAISYLMREPGESNPKVYDYSTKTTTKVDGVTINPDAYRHRAAIDAGTFPICNGYNWVTVKKPNEAQEEDYNPSSKDPEKGYYWGYYKDALRIDQEATPGHTGAIVISW